MLNVKSITGVFVTVVILAGVGTLWLSDKPQPQAPVGSPLLSLQEILAASDLEKAALDTAQTNQPQALNDALDLALNVARQAGLSDRDIAYLQSESARNYLLFKARRKMFFSQFEQRYLALQPIDELKREFPEAKDLFARADEMVRQRDAQILSIARQLAGEQGNVEAYLSLARQQWAERTKTSAEFAQ